MTVTGYHVETPGRLCCVRDPRPRLSGLLRPVVAGGGGQSHSDLSFSYFLITGVWPTCFHFTLCRGSSEKTEQSLTSPMSVFSGPFFKDSCSALLLSEGPGEKALCFLSSVLLWCPFHSETRVQKRAFHKRLKCKNLRFTRGSGTETFISQEAQVQKHTFHKRLRYKNVRFTRGSSTKAHFTRGEQRLKDPLSAISASSNCHLSQCISETQIYNHSTYIQLPISSTAKITKPFCLLLEPNLSVYEALMNTSHKACLSWDFPGDPEIKINIFKKILKACLSSWSEIIKCISSFFN